MKITVNGTEYSSWDEVPEDARRLLMASGAFADSDHDGVPDFAEGGGAESLKSGRFVSRVTKRITVGDKTYDSVDDVPPALRATLERAGLIQPGEAATDSARPAESTAPSGEVLLNGVPIDDKPRKKRWWRR